MSKSTENIVESYNDLRLLSINEARKILGIRYEKTKQLIDKGKIKSININGRKKLLLNTYMNF